MGNDQKASQIGKFMVPSISVKHDPCRVAKVLAAINFVPYRVELLFHENKFEYLGWSPKFRPVKDGETIPLYDIVVNDLGNRFDVSVRECP